MIKTLAVKITPATYPIAVACLPAGFALIKKRLVMGAYLVINDLQFPDYDPRSESEEECADRPHIPRRARYMRQPYNEGLTLANFWIPKKLFKKDFEKVLDNSPLDSFFEVTRK